MNNTVLLALKCALVKKDGFTLKRGQKSSKKEKGGLIPNNGSKRRSSVVANGSYCCYVVSVKHYNSVWSLTSGSTLHVTLWARTALGGRIGARAAGRPRGRPARARCAALPADAGCRPRRARDTFCDRRTAEPAAIVSILTPESNVKDQTLLMC